MVIKVAVIGAGPNGLASAVKIKEKYKSSRVVIFSDELTPDTTGDGSGGLWLPYLCGETSDQLLTKWGVETFNYLHKLWLEGGSDVCLVPAYYLGSSSRSQPERPGWADRVFGYQTLSEKDLKYLSKIHSQVYTSGQSFTTFIVSPPTVLGNLMKQFIYIGGEVIRAKVTSLQDPILNEFDVIVNCSGLGAKWIVPDDGVFPIRGQITKVTAPWVSIAVLGKENGNYILPNVSFCIMGGTHQENDYNKNVVENDTEFILKGCTKIMPSLEKAEVQRHWVGLRPGRHEIRLESEHKNGKLYIHNYGHGGSGLTLFWGCASDVVSLLDAHYKLALSKL